ncbi:probable 3',5'-cyclic phosphodiesterase pde-5 [Atheta coriaria]|uniref:probable 3',5'-cyclic phosphodiesterase pde-5 n=1 Tax=Dalotia coriaria TaxID=877792 RepID=UPI0031F3674F
MFTQSTSSRYAGKEQITPVLANMASSHHSMNEHDVVQYLKLHPELVEKYVLTEVEPEVLDSWATRRTPMRKTQRSEDGRKTSLSKWRCFQDRRKMLEELVQSLKKNLRREQVLWELANCITAATDSDGLRLFLIDNPEHPEKLRLYTDGDNAAHTHGRCGSGSFRLGSAEDSRELRNTSLRNFVVKHRSQLERRESIQTSGIPIDKLNGNQSDDKTDQAENCEQCDADDNYHFMCLPVMQSNQEMCAVLELYRCPDRNEFTSEEEEIALSYLIWGGIALHYAQLYNNMNQQRSLNAFLLDVVRSIFQDMVSMDPLVTKIMDFAQKLVDADRASLFLLDEKNNSLYSQIFDVGDSSLMDQNEEIRFPLGKGIAGHVAKTGEILNITDAYSDARFNPEVDKKTGYKTNSILCMPVYRSKKSIIGVVQMVNKHHGVFTTHDEEAFKTFAVYCGLALHHAELYNQIKKSEQKYKVAVEVLSYHRSCTEEEFQQALEEEIPLAIPGIDDYYFNPFELKEMEQVKHAMFMFYDLFDMEKFDRHSMLKFTLTVKKNYRRVPYHNWTHGFSVANSMYSIIKKSKHVFKEVESLALFIAALCHDLDHRGKNNKYMLDTQSPLASIYSTSTMEHHHFNQTVTILQQDGHNIFHKLSSDQFKQILALIKHCILATDLATFWDTRKSLQALVDSDTFCRENAEHMSLLQAIAMTASDLSASAKPWDVQVKTVDIIFKEFYDQGDAELAAGRTPIPMMDRRRHEEQPASQVEFLHNICTPCYTLLYKLVPETKPLLDMVDENLEKWKIKKESSILPVSL